MQLPLLLLESLKGTKGFDRGSFEKLHASGEQLTSIRINPGKPALQFTDLQTVQSDPVPWTRFGYYLSSRPSFTFDPLFHAGCYYVQEASSMFLEQALQQTVDLSKPLKVLDCCAAPGGKSTHIHSLVSEDSLLVSNEVIRSRANILKDNIIKWGCGNVVVTNNDPKEFSMLKNYFDVIVADAPCSGSGLFRKDPEAMNEWSGNNVQLCSQRQHRILADILPALKHGGILIYSTCSYSKEENEDITNWLQQEFTMEFAALTTDPAWGITDTGLGCRFWPDRVKGEGFFIACLRKPNEEGFNKEDTKRMGKSRVEYLSRKETDIAKQWIRTEGKTLVRNKSTVYAWPEKLSRDFGFLLECLNVVYSGVRVGEIVRDKLIPDHALAMSSIASETTGKMELDHIQAIRYLQRNDFVPSGGISGWQLVTYSDHPLGWANRLPNRVNNYYPKELRILKQS